MQDTAAPPPLRLSVVIPLGPGEAEEGPLLNALRALPAGSEVLLVRAGGDARPAPPGWPPALPLRQIDAARGRAKQMNRGAEVARGQWLWFLHADTRFEPGVLVALEHFLGRGEAALGWFDLAFRDDGPRLARLNALGANWRSAWLGIPFGDQGFVLPAEVFWQLGGYDETAAYGEDHLLVWAAHGQRLPLRRLRAGLRTSARKYARLGWGATTWLHWRLTAVQAWGAWRRNRRRRPNPR
jgi:glycosyltransferase involved in cell wall biosynthesis